MSSDDVPLGREDRNHARNNSPSLTGRVRSLTTRPSLRSQDGITSRTQSADSRRELNDDGDDSVAGSINAPQPPTQPEAEFRDEAVRSLQSSHSLASRVTALNSVSQNVAYYSPATVVKVLDTIEDLAQSDSSLKGREAVFAFIKSASSTPELSAAHISRLFDLAVSPVSGSGTEAQVKAIEALYANHPITPSMRDDLVKYFNNTIRSQFAALSEARPTAKGSSHRPRGPLPEEKGLHLLLSFISTTLRDDAMTLDEANLVSIVKDTVYIAENTTSKYDMKKAVELLKTIIEDEGIPASELKSSVEIFCAIANAIPDLNPLTWECLMLLLVSPRQDETVQILLDTLALAPTSRHSHTVCGALGVLVQLVAHTNTQLPKVGFGLFIDSLWGVHFASRRIRRDCLKTIRSLLSDPNLEDESLQCRWDHMVQIILTATGDETYIHDRMSEPLTIRDAGTAKDLEKVQDSAEATGHVALAEDILQELRQVADFFNARWYDLNPEQRQLVGLFYYKLRLVLPPTQLRDLLNRLRDDGYFLPSSTDWQNHQIEMLRLFVWDSELDPDVGCFVVQILSTSASDAPVSDREHFQMLILRLLNEFEPRMTVPIANELAKLARTVWQQRNPSSLSENLDRFWPLLCVDEESKEPRDIRGGREAPSNEVSITFVSLFIDYYEHDAACASVLFEFLVKIAKSQSIPATARLPVLRLLVRLRCNETGNMMIIDEPDALGLAVNLSRAEGPPSLHGSASQSDKASESEETLNTRAARASTLSHSSQGTVRGSLRVPSSFERHQRVSPARPLWIYPGPPGLPRYPSRELVPTLYASSTNSSDAASLRLTEWLIAVIDILQQGGDWEVYSYIIVHLPSQLANPSLFSDAVSHIKMLRNVIASQLQDGNFQEPPPDAGAKKGDIAFCLVSALTMLLAYSEHFARGEQDDMIKAFLFGIDGWDRTPKACVQAIAIACHQTPWAVTRVLPAIIRKLSQIITQSQLSVDILELLGGLARLPNLYANFHEDDYRVVFAICVRYLEHARDQRLRMMGANPSGAGYNPNRVSGISVRSTPSSDPGHQLEIHKDLPQYVFALTHHVITVWFLSLKLADRSNHVGWITSKLVWTDQHRNEIMEEQSQVTLDMMHRTAYLDLGETVPMTVFGPADGRTMTKSWIVGMSIVTIETATASGLTQITKRQASGTTYASYQQQTAPLLSHHVLAPSEVTSSVTGLENQVNIFPNHVLLQLTSTIAPTPTPMEAICLPDDDITRRAITSFDRNDTVDGFKVGVIYIGPGQKGEAEILANTRGSEAYHHFLDGLGTKVRLKDAKFNTQGLDRHDDMDGLYTYAWRDRVAELVFHVPTMMPTDAEADPSCVNKKRHIGNDFVKVVFNESGLPFDIDTFSSQFNYVNIIITPEAGCPGSGPTELATAPAGPTKASYFTIQTVTNPQLPDISPTASFKLLASANLPAFVRHVALHSSVFSNVWVNREGGEHVSSWRNRLREIVRLRDRFANTGTSASTRFPGARATRTYASGDSFHGRVGMGGLLEEEGVLSSLDFSRWAGANHPTT